MAARGGAPGHASVAMRGMQARPGAGFRPGLGFHGGPGFGNRHFFPRHHHHFFFNSGCYYGYCNPGYYGYYTPPIFWSGFDYPAYDYGAQTAQAAPAYDDSALRVQIQRLTDEVEQLREEQQTRIRPPQPAAETRSSRPDPPTVLVFHDGKRAEVRNYAIVGETLWVFGGQHARKIPLGELDLVATRSVNQESGVGFVVPESR